MTDVELSMEEGAGCSLSWSPDSHFLARLSGECIHVTDSRYSFCQVASVRLGGSSLRNIAFCPKSDEDSNGTLLAAVGLDGNVHLLKFIAGENRMDILHSVFVEENLWVVEWSSGNVGYGFLFGTALTLRTRVSLTVSFHVPI